MKQFFVGARAAVFGAGFVTLWTLVALWTRRFDDQFGLARQSAEGATAAGRLPSWSPTLGVLVLGIGAAVAITCIGLFVVRGRGTPAPFDPPRAFVAVGPYSLIRNPMYVGGWLALVGLGLIVQSPSILLFSVAWLCIAHLFVVVYEERALTSKFGATYQQYCRTVPRWVPRKIT